MSYNQADALEYAMNNLKWSKRIQELEEENAKLKQALKAYQKYTEIMTIDDEARISLKVDFICVSKQLTKEDYELLKELENDK